MKTTLIIILSITTIVALSFFIYSLDQKALSDRNAQIAHLKLMEVEKQYKTQIDQLTLENDSLQKELLNCQK